MTVAREIVVAGGRLSALWDKVFMAYDFYF